MSDEQQPRAEWIFPEEKKSSKARVWLIIGLTVVALVIVGVVLLFVIPRSDGPNPAASVTPTTTATTSATPTPTNTDEPDDAEPSETPMPTPPPGNEPDLETFAGDVQPRLDDGVRGLDLVQDNLDVGGQIVESLQQDAGILAGSAAPSSIVDDWSAAVSDYTSKLRDLRAALDNGTDPQSALNASRVALNTIRSLIGL